MGGESWSLTAKPCDSCKTASSTIFCRADSAFLCTGCDTKIHVANKVASRHARVWVCDVCEQAPASVTCKADAAALCVSCDRDIHSANPLARRHDRFPVIPFYDSPATKHDTEYNENDVYNNENDKYFSDGDGDSEEAEAASWLLPTPNPNPNKMFGEMESYLYLDMMVDEKQQQNHHNEQYSSGGNDGVVPVHSKNDVYQPQVHGLVVDGFPTSTHEMDYAPGSKPFMYNFSSQSISQSVSSSSLDVGVVPDHNAMADVSNSFPVKSTASDTVPNPISRIDRESRVLRYREKRKNRKFEKTIRYASRKAYAETRPRIKGRFAKRSEIEIESFIIRDASYSVVPTFKAF